MSTGKSQTEYRIERKFQVRVYFFVGVILTTAFILAMQLLWLQVVNGSQNRLLAKKFVSRQEFMTAPRGLIYDRNWQNGTEPLVKNITYVDFIIYPARFANRDEAASFLQAFSKIMGKPFSLYTDILEPANWKRLVRRNETVTLLTQMSRREHERLAEFHLADQYGKFQTNHLRYYTMGPALAHVTGYIGLPSRKELEMKLALPYQMLGKGGIEARYDQELRGTDGIRVRHRVVEAEEEISESEQGSNLVLSINRDVQAAAYRSLTKGGKRGTAIAIRPTTGEIIALASIPTFDPNVLSSTDNEHRNEHYRLVQRHKGFLNLAMQAKFPPASTFKPLVALAALESPEIQGIDENTTFTCHGRWVLTSTVPGVPNQEFFCWKRDGHGTLNMIGGLAHSCNVYFYNLGYKIGPTPIINYSRAFNFDKKSGIDLAGEVSGFVPDQRWKQVTWSNRWYDGDTINLSIGQGFLEVTPIEVALFFSALANRGKMYRPHILNEVRDPLTDRLLRKIQPELIKEVPISTHSLDVILRGMRQVITLGTAQGLNRPDLVPIAGKTGTVQTRSHRQGLDHAWFAGIAPYGAPPEETLVVVVFIEYGLGGAAAAAPIAADIFKAAFPNYKGTPNQVAPVFKLDSIPSIKTGEDATPPPTLPAQKDEM